MMLTAGRNIKIERHFSAPSWMKCINYSANQKKEHFNEHFSLQENKKRIVENSCKSLSEDIFRNYMQMDQKVTRKWTEKGSVIGLASSDWECPKEKEFCSLICFNQF